MKAAPFTLVIVALAGCGAPAAAPFCPGLEGAVVNLHLAGQMSEPVLHLSFEGSLNDTVHRITMAVDAEQKASMHKDLHTGTQILRVGHEANVHYNSTSFYLRDYGPDHSWQNDRQEILELWQTFLSTALDHELPEYAYSCARDGLSYTVTYSRDPILATYTFTPDSTVVRLSDPVHKVVGLLNMTHTWTPPTIDAMLPRAPAMILIDFDRNEEFDNGSYYSRARVVPNTEVVPYMDIEFRYANTVTGELLGGGVLVDGTTVFDDGSRLIYQDANANKFLDAGDLLVMDMNADRGVMFFDSWAQDRVFFTTEYLR